MTRSSLTRLSIGLLTILPLSIGCGGDGLDRQSISGTVEVGGVPIVEGKITLVPLDTGVSCGGTIEDGRFTIDAEDGPIPGRYRVEFFATRGTGEMVPDSDFPDQMMEIHESIIPDRYRGTQSEETIEVNSNGENTFPFNLESS